MDPLEQALRLAWQLDFGEQPEQTMARAQKSVTPSIFECRLGETHFKLSAKTMVTNHRGSLIREAKRSNIDARAIASVISWEYEENWKGRFSDYFQAPTGGSATAGLGWGSIHTPEARKLRPYATDGQLLCMRMEAEPAIRLIAEFMDKMATLYEKESEGITLRNNPAALAFVFNTGEAATRRSARARRGAPFVGGKVSLDVTPNAMASWVHRNLSRFSDLTTVPMLPDSAIEVFIGKWASE